jgi:beta-lactamase regulating signal transducer with metallopeptidase domain/type II secretory pathway component GspD/PulD (secretin)
MIVLQNILSQEIVERLGWTLLHFIWQAVAVALILTILLRILRKSTANLRYIFASLALGLTVLLPIITILLVPTTAPSPAINIAPAPLSTTLPTVEFPEPDTIFIAKSSQMESITEAPSVPFKQRVVDTLEPSLPYIVSGWLIGVFGLSIWHLGGWTQLQRLKRRMVKQVDSTLHNKLKVLAKKLKVKQTVQLMESALVQIPTVVGWLRPVILLPASALTGLNTEQLEAIIAHELAHIKRFDYLSNILQTIVEILGFYHPAVWWISYKIRTERENCCDDMAVSISGDRVSYAGALASMEEIRAAQAKLAVAAGGGNLFRRICRLLAKDSANNTGLSWIPATTVILLIIALAIPTTLALTTKSDSLINEPQAKLQIEDDIQIPSTDSLEKTETQIDAEKDQSDGKLKVFGLAVAMYADDHDGNLPESIQELRPWIRGQQNFNWLRDNVEYFDKGKTAQRNAAFIPIAYDRTLLEKADGTNVLFLDSSVRFVKTKEFEKLNMKSSVSSDEDKVQFELSEITQRIESANKLSNLGKALLIYANDNNDKYPNSLKQLSDYFGKVEDFHWVLENAAYLGSGKTISDRPDAVMAYDKKLLIKEKGTNVLFNDCHVSFKKVEDLKKLGINITDNQFLIDTRILLVNKDFIQNINLNADSSDQARELIKLIPVLVDAMDGHNKLSFIPPEYNINLILKALLAHKDSKIIANPQVLAREGKTAEISIMSNEIFYPFDYTEPNSPSEKPEPIFKSVEEGIKLALKPKLTPNKNIDMEFELELSQVSGFKEKMYKGKYTCKLPTIQRIHQATKYTAKDGQTLLFAGHKIADKWGGQSEQKELLLLITTHTIGLSEQDKLAQAKKQEATEPKILQTTTEISKDDEQEKTKPATEQRRRRPASLVDDPLEKIENKNQIVQKLFKLKHYNASQMKQIILPLISENGHISVVESTNSLLVIDKVMNLMRLERIIEQYDVSKSEQVVTQIFEIRNGDPVEIVELLKKFINGPEAGAIIESSNGPIVLIPEPMRKWIIAKASAENIKQIGQWIEKLDIDKTTIGLDPIDKAVHEQLEKIVDLSNLSPGMSFSEVIEILENSVEPPVQIQPIWKDLLENAEIEPATPAGLDPLPHIKLRKALEILLTSVTSTQLGEFGELTYIVDQGVILIGTELMLTPRMLKLVPEPSDLVETATDAAKASHENIKQIVQSIEKIGTRNNIGIDPIDKAVYEQLETIVDLPGLSPEMSFKDVIEMLENSVEPPVQIQPIWRDLLENAEVEPATPAGIDPLTGIKLRKALEVLLIGISSTELPKVTYVVDDGVILIGTERMLTPRMLKSTPEQSDLVETTPDTAQPSYKKPEEPTPAIKQHQMQILRQKYINDDIKVKSLNEKITKVEKELTELRQKYTQKHPAAQTKSKTLHGLTTAIRERKKEVGKTFDELMKEETDKSNRERITTLLDELQKKLERELESSKVPPTDDAKKAKTPSEQIQEQLDELIKQQQAHEVKEPNLLPIPKVRLVNNIFVDCPIINALQAIAEAAKVNIITDETVKGLVSCKLKDVTVEKALDTILAGTPYIWKKTPYYYLVVSADTIRVKPAIILIRHADVDELVSRLNEAIKQMPDLTSVIIEPVKNTRKIIVISKNDDDKEIIKKLIAEMDIPDSKLKPPQSQVKEDLTLLEIETRVESAKKLSELGRALLIYANDHKDNYPNSLKRLSDYFRKLEDFNWVLENAVYLGAGKTTSDRPDAVMAYDKQLMAKGKGTNVLYNDCHVSFLNAEELKKLGIRKQLIFEANIWVVSDDFLKTVGLNTNPENFSDAWRGRLAATYPYMQKGLSNVKLYSLIIDDLHFNFLRRILHSHKDAYHMSNPQFLYQEGKTTEIALLAKAIFFMQKEEPKYIELDKVKINPRILLTPELADDIQTVNLDMNLQIRKLKETKKGSSSIYEPTNEVTDIKMPCTIPKGKTMLFGALEINQQAKIIMFIKPIIYIEDTFKSYQLF